MAVVAMRTMLSTWKIREIFADITIVRAITRIGICSPNTTFASIVIEELDNVKMAAPRRKDQGVVCTPLCAIRVKELHDVQMTHLCCVVHGVGGAPFRSTIVQEEQHLHLATECCVKHCAFAKERGVVNVIDPVEMWSIKLIWPEAAACSTSCTRLNTSLNVYYL
ncbi:hypothetical protein SAMD00019534_038130 [Acytostelium subglobosum LB1]|uniref:hypothetical protein n=1 Tax=Acytostelium subglobosum LB1 TaxID=1410327 RepID=UPI000644AF58|nr:hypothetical protein SAMD00019534_038130 [Acytostelium subglobosum LB1]GAM20638.1 hypothetical protein SAMD00019534_038130 [Acytostelium subglobosum LB1]|eukprot:XP_012760159.1 hypothetical protein SAMD00019534_038130 [Acytostelium subglobosum LB1]